MQNRFRRRHCSIEKLECRHLLEGSSSYLSDNSSPSYHQGIVVRVNEPSPVTFEPTVLHVAGSNASRSVVLVNMPQHGAAEISSDGRSILYKPTANFVGKDSLSYYFTSDGNQNSPVVFSVSIQVLEQTWLALPDWTQTRSGQSVALDVIRNDVPNANFVGAETWKLSLMDAQIGRCQRWQDAYL